MLLMDEFTSSLVQVGLNCRVHCKPGLNVTSPRQKARLLICRYHAKVTLTLLLWRVVLCDKYPLAAICLGYVISHLCSVSLTSRSLAGLNVEGVSIK